MNVAAFGPYAERAIQRPALSPRSARRPLLLSQWMGSEMLGRNASRFSNR